MPKRRKRYGCEIPAAFAIASVAVGLVGIWMFAGIAGGALPLLDYLAKVQGILVPIELAVSRRRERGHEPDEVRHHVVGQRPRGERA